MRPLYSFLRPLPCYSMEAPIKRTPSASIQSNVSRPQPKIIQPRLTPHTHGICSIIILAHTSTILRDTAFVFLMLEHQKSILISFSTHHALQHSTPCLCYKLLFSDYTHKIVYPNTTTLSGTFRLPYLFVLICPVRTNHLSNALHSSIPYVNAKTYRSMPHVL